MYSGGDHRHGATVTRTIASVLALTVVLASPAQAQAEPPVPAPSSADKPPVAVGADWRYEKRSPEGRDLHQFFCQQPACGPHSAVSYRIYAPHAAMTLEQFRQDQERILRMLQERAAPGTRITSLEITGDDGGKIPSMFVARRLTEFPNGAKEYRVSSTLYGAKYTASLISTSQDEKAATANHALFTVGVMLFVNSGVPLAIGANPR